jgi:hypothetical protein
MAVAPIEHAANMFMIGFFLCRPGETQEWHKQKQPKIATKEIHTLPSPAEDCTFLETLLLLEQYRLIEFLEHHKTN